jgi:hypothetical protein
MGQSAQAHLAELISFARIGPPSTLDADEWKPRTFTGFTSALAAFRAVGAVAPEEAQEWTNRFLVALGEEPPEPLPPGVSGARMMSLGKHRTPRPPDPPPASIFRGLMPVREPDRPLDYGGRLQVLGVELYSDAVTINWRLAPEPDYDLVFATELAAQEPDLDGLSEEHRTILRRQLVQRLEMQRRFLGLSDDMGTQYHQMGGGSSGGPRGKRGHTDFSPAVPADANRLTVTWDAEMEFEVQLNY